eukprot:CAMPEP_0172381560 /NCGR_PEP_ID=MMETSP1060-20121228/71013_1 /TAXON_ID=37318 /ORGANISM="Pseudo-nitzschia pungens, Strain cf. cingulata" /LENGTH=192 /DNA_ID=CAMNT_0013109341 /DNA_START=2022 /DNA_END=2599 /DNA_ORIENTATION=-
MSLRDFMQGLVCDCAAAQRNDGNANSNSGGVTNVHITIVSDNSSSTLCPSLTSPRLSQQTTSIRSIPAAYHPGMIDDFTFTVSVPFLDRSGDSSHEPRHLFDLARDTCDSEVEDEDEGWAVSPAWPNVAADFPGDAAERGKRSLARVSQGSTPKDPADEDRRQPYSFAGGGHVPASPAARVITTQCTTDSVP